MFNTIIVGMKPQLCVEAYIIKIILITYLRVIFSFIH